MPLSYTTRRSPPSGYTSPPFTGAWFEPLKDSASGTAAVCPAPDRGMDAAYRSPASAPSVTRV